LILELSLKLGKEMGVIVRRISISILENGGMIDKQTQIVVKLNEICLQRRDERPFHNQKMSWSFVENLK
jgi:hypothetical protein